MDVTMKNNLTTTQNKNTVLSKNRAILNIASKILASDSLIHREVVEEWVPPTIKKTTELKTVGRISDDPNRVIEFKDNIDAWIDKDTGLMWEVKTGKNIKHEYVWSEDNVETDL